MSALLSAAVAVLVVVALGLSIVAWWATVRRRRLRLGLLAAGFTVIAMGGAVTAWILWRGGALQNALTLQSLLTSSGLVLVYLAAVKR